MKQGTKVSLSVDVGVDFELISSLTFLFKQENDERCAVSVRKEYPGSEVSYDSSEGVFVVSFSDADTRKFEAGKRFYMDTRVRLVNGKIPNTDIVPLTMTNTLFTVEEEGD